MPPNRLKESKDEEKTSSHPSSVHGGGVWEKYICTSILLHSYGHPISHEEEEVLSQCCLPPSFVRERRTTWSECYSDAIESELNSPSCFLFDCLWSCSLGCLCDYCVVFSLCGKSTQYWYKPLSLHFIPLRNMANQLYLYVFLLCNNIHLPLSPCLYFWLQWMLSNV